MSLKSDFAQSTPITILRDTGTSQSLILADTLPFSEKTSSGTSVLIQGVECGPKFYGDLVYKLLKIIGKNDFPYHFKKIVVRYKKIGYNINVMRQTACLVVNPIKVNSFAYLFNCTTVGRTAD